MATTYSNTSLDTIDVDSLKSSRFLLPDKRLLPYRNAAGDVHLGLLEHSMKLIQSGTVQAPQAIVEKTSKWLKHCRRHFTESDKKPTPVTAGSGSSKSLARVPAPQQQQAPDQREDSTRRPCSGWVGRLQRPRISRTRSMIACSTVTGFLNTIQITSSVHGGVVNEPSYLQ